MAGWLAMAGGFGEAAVVIVVVGGVERYTGACAEDSARWQRLQ